MILNEQIVLKYDSQLSISIMAVSLSWFLETKVASATRKVTATLVGFYVQLFVVLFLAQHHNRGTKWSWGRRRRRHRMFYSFPNTETHGSLIVFSVSTQCNYIIGPFRSSRGFWEPAAEQRQQEELMRWVNDKRSTLWSDWNMFSTEHHAMRAQNVHSRLTQLWVRPCTEKEKWSTGEVLFLLCI